MKNLPKMNTKSMIASIAPVLRRHGVRRASLFGSVVRAEQTEGSDVDLLVELEDGRSLLDLVGIKLDLEELLRRDVDVLTYDSLHPLLRDSVLREQKQIYEA